MGTVVIVLGEGVGAVNGVERLNGTMIIFDLILLAKNSYSS